MDARRAKRKSWLALAMAVATAGAARGAVISTWSAANSGYWSEPNRWSTNPLYPTNDGITEYDARITASGSPYTVTLDAFVDLNTLLVDSANARLEAAGSWLSTTGDTTVRRGTVDVNVGSIYVGGHLFVADALGAGASVAVSQINSTLGVSGNLYLGGNATTAQGTASLSVTGGPSGEWGGGAELVVSGLARVYAGSTLTVSNRSRLEVGALERQAGATLSLKEGFVAINTGDLAVKTGETFGANLVIDGDANDNLDGGGTMLSLTLGGGDLRVGQGTSAGTLVVRDAASLAVSGRLIVDNLGSAAINHSTVSAAGIDRLGGGAITFMQSTLYLGTDGLAVGPGALLGANLTVAQDGSSPLTELQTYGASDVTAGTLTVGNGGMVWVHGPLNIGAGGTVTLNDPSALLAFHELTRDAAGTLNFSAGRLLITAQDLTLDSSATAPLGNSMTLGSGKRLELGRNLTLAAGSSLQISGGTLDLGILTQMPGSTFSFTSGLLRTGQDLAVDSLSATPFLGAAYTGGADKSLQTAGRITVGVAGSGSVLLNGGSGALRSQRTLVGDAAGSVGVITIGGDGGAAGAGAGLWHTDYLTIFGGLGSATVVINNGQFDAGAAFHAAFSPGSNANITIGTGNGPAALLGDGTMVLGGDVSAAGGNASVTVNTDGLFGGLYSFSTPSLYLQPSGHLTLNGGVVQLGRLFNLGGGITFNSGTLRVVSAAQTVSVGAGEPLGPSVTLPAGSAAQVTGSGSKLRVLAGATLANNGIVTTPRVEVDANGTVQGTGTFGGPAFVAHVLANAGTVAPGNSAGRLIVNGSYEQGPAGRLAIELGGTVVATQYDQLQANVDVSLAGLLDVTAINGFVPAVSDEFAVLRWFGQRTGTFSQVLYNGQDITTLPGRVTYDDANGLLVLTMLPEPSSMVMIVLAGLAMRRRRRN